MVYVQAESGVHANIKCAAQLEPSPMTQIEKGGDGSLQAETFSESSRALALLLVRIFNLGSPSLSLCLGRHLPTTQSKDRTSKDTIFSGSAYAVERILISTLTFGGPSGHNIEHNNGIVACITATPSLCCSTSGTSPCCSHTLRSTRSNMPTCAISRRRLTLGDIVYLRCLQELERLFRFSHSLSHTNSTTPRSAN
jgi:hypothetical protein